MEVAAPPRPVDPDRVGHVPVVEATQPPAGTSGRLARGANVAAMLVLVSLAWFAGAAVALPLIALAAVARALPRSTSMGQRCVLGVLIVLTALIPLTWVLQSFGAGLHPLATWGALAIIAAALRTPRDRGGTRSISAAVAHALPAALGVAVVGFLATAGFVDVAAPGAGVDQRLALLAASEDGASHFAIYDTILHVDGLAYNAAAKRYSVQWSYPPVFHLAAASLEHSLEHTRGTNRLRGGPIDAFWAATLLAFGLLVTATASMAAAASRALGGGLKAASMSAIAAASAVSFWVPFGLFQLGFYPQVLAVALLCIQVTALLQRRQLGFTASLVLAASSLVVISWTWYFLSPISAVLVLAWLVASRRDVLDRKLVTGGTAVFAVELACIPVWQGAKAGSFSAVNAGGGVAAVPMPLLIGTVAAALAVLLAHRHLASRAARVLLAFVIAVAVAFSTAFYLYQSRTLGAPAYFYYKSLYTVLLVAIPIALGGLMAKVLPRGGRVAPRLVAVAVLTTIAIGGLVGIRPDARTTSGAWLYRDGALASGHRATFARYLEDEQAVKGKYLFVWNLTGDGPQDYFGSRWLNALNGRTTKEFFDFMATVVWTQDDALMATFIEQHPGEVVLITGQPDLRTRLGRAGVSPRTLSDLTILAR